MATVRLPDGKTIAFPDYMTKEEMDQEISNYLVSQQPATVQALRGASAGAKGLTDSALETVGAVPDIVAAGLRKVGLPAPSDPDFYANALKSGYNKIANTMSAPIDALYPEGASAPLSETEKILYSSGRGAGDAASFMVPGAMLAKGAKAGSTAANVGRTLAAQPVMQMGAGAVGGGVTEATDNPLYGLAAAMATPMASNLAKRAVTPVRHRLSPEEIRLTQIAEKEDIPLSVADRTGSRPFHYMESVFGDLPLTAGTQQQIDDAQRAAFNRAVMRRAGSEADSASPEILAGLKKSLSGEFSAMNKGLVLPVDDILTGSVDDVVGQYSRTLDSMQRPVIEAFANDIKNGVALDGATYQAARSNLGAMAQSAKGTYKLALKGLQRALDDAAERATPENLKGARGDLNRRYGNFKNISKAMEGSTAAATAGDIPPTALSSAVRMQNRGNFATGSGDLNDLARVGTAFVRDNTPNSGTPTRNFMTNAMTYGAPLAAGTASYGDPALAAANMAVAMALPRGVQAAYNSPLMQGYLTNRLLEVSKYSPELAAKIFMASQKTPAVEGLKGR